MTIYDFLAWRDAALERDNAERRGPVLTALGEPRCICSGDETGEAPDVRPDCPAHDVWAETARAWPPDKPPPF